MNPLNKIISRSRFGNKTSTFAICDNSPIGDYILDALDTFPPEDGIAQLRRLHKELGDKIASLEGASKAWDAPNAPPRQVKSGILANPYQGRVDRVEGKDVPALKGGMVKVYKIHTGAAMFETYDRNVAAQAFRAQQAGEEVSIRWKPRVKGRYTNYDIVAFRVLNPHGRSQL